MVNRAFQYDLSSEKWIECTDEKFINDDIEKIPCVLVVRFSDFEYDVYCPKHHRIESIFCSIDSGDSELISDEGCKFQESDILRDKKLLYCPIHKQLEEIILIDGNEIITDTFCKFTGLTGVADYYHHNVPFRWRIFQSSDKNFVNIAADIAGRREKSFDFLRHWNNFFISISVSKGSFLKNCLQTGEDIPDIVMDVAMETLRDSTKAIYGIKPTVITKFKGVEKIFAYVERPFDLNIILLKKIFSDFGDFDKIFPYDCKDNYKIICRLLEIKPPKSLRKAYAENPYAIIWYMIFKQWGVKDINFMQKFFRFDNCISNMYLSKFYFNTKLKKVMRKENSDNWREIEYYYQWLLKEKGEKFMMNRLYKTTEQGLSSWQWDILHQLYLYGDKLSEEIKKFLVKDGLTNFVHDLISWKIREVLEHLENVRVIFSPEILKYEATINGYEFKLVRDTKTLYFVSLELENCVMGYRDKFLTQESIIVVVIKNKKYVACIEIRGKNSVVQALGVHNQKLEGELLFVFELWTAWKNLIDCSEHDSTPIIQCENIESCTDFGSFVGSLVLKTMWV